MPRGTGGSAERHMVHIRVRLIFPETINQYKLISIQECQFHPEINEMMFLIDPTEGPCEP